MCWTAPDGQFISAEKVAKVTWAEKIDPKTGRPVENPGIRYQGKPGLFEIWPGPTGAHAWMPQAYSPRTGLVYIPIQEQGALIGEGQKGGGEIAAGMGVTLLPEANLKEGAHAFLKAMDPATQREVVEDRAARIMAGGRAGDRWRSGVPGPHGRASRRL